MTYDDDPGPEPDQAGNDWPRDRDAEQAVLTAMMLTPTCITTVERIITPDDYDTPAHALIHQAILHVHATSRDGRPDPIRVTAHLTETGQLHAAGGHGYVHACLRPDVTAGNAEYYAEIVRAKSRLRALIRAGARLVQAARAGEADPDALLDSVLAELHSLIADGGQDAPGLSVADRWDGFVDELEAGKDPGALDTPWKDLNDVIELKPGQLITVGAETGGGKSLLGMNIAAHAALRRERPVLVASMEMGGSELLARLTAAEASVNLDHLIKRQLTERDWQRIARVSERMRRASHYILDDSPALTVSKIRARIRWMTAEGMPPGLVVADYLQLITPEGGSAGRNRTQEVAAISRDLKVLAMEFQVPVIALAQFNRGAVGRRPQVTDFKDSSQVEQDSNLVLLMWRDLPPEGEEPGPDDGKRHLEVAKNRNGPRGRVVDLEQQGHYARLVSRTTEEPPARNWSEIGVH